VVAAYTFYSVLFRKNPFEIANYEKLTDGVNFNIKSSVHLVAFDKLNWWNIGDNDCIPAFSSIIKDTSKILLINQSKNSDYILWNYNKTKLNTNQSYNINFKEYGNYEIKLFAKNCFSNASHSSKLRYGGKGISLDTDKLIFLKYFKNSKFLQVNCDEHLNLSDLTIEIFSTDNKLLLKFTPQKYSSSIDLLYFPNFIKVKIKGMNKIILETGIQVH